MPKQQRFILTLIVVSASFIPVANALAEAPLGGTNHSETLLLDS